MLITESVLANFVVAAFPSQTSFFKRELNEQAGPMPAPATPDGDFMPGDFMEDASEMTVHSRPVRRIGRNDRCFCGSGLKFKNCCARKV
jgi:uncharacterized protein YecA (UPF0149 family)